MTTFKLKRLKIQQKLFLLLTIVVVVIAILCIRYWFNHSALNPLSEDAVVSASVIPISSVVPGRIVEIYVEENQKVEQGDLLFKIDPTPYQLRVDQAQAAVDMAEATLRLKQRNIIAERSNSEIVTQEIVKMETNLKLATESLNRLLPLYKQGYVTKQQIDDATTLKNDAEITYQQTLKQAVAAEALVNDTASEEAFLLSQQKLLALARWDLENTEIRAPHSGWVVGLTTSKGKFVISGESLFSLVNNSSWHVSAYFRETELPNIHLGSCVNVYVLSDKSRMIKGTVQGIGWGVLSTDVLDLPSLLPYIPKSLNWVSVEQRFAVRIDLIDPPEDLMRVGATALAIIQEQCDPS